MHLRRNQFRCSNPRFLHCLHAASLALPQDFNSMTPAACDIRRCPLWKMPEQLWHSAQFRKNLPILQYPHTEMRMIAIILHLFQA